MSVADLAFQGCLRLLQLNELDSELGHTTLSTLHSPGRVAVLSDDLQDALYAQHAVGPLLCCRLQPGKQLLRCLPGISGCLCIPAGQHTIPFVQSFSAKACLSMDSACLWCTGDATCCPSVPTMLFLLPEHVHQ